MLRVVVGYGETRFESIKAAVDVYNEIEGIKYLFEKDVTRASEDGNLVLANQWVTEIWFEHTEAQDSNEALEFIGSRGVDPNDPDWREKLGYSVSLPDGSGLIEGSESWDNTSATLEPLRMAPVEE